MMAVGQDLQLSRSESRELDTIRGAESLASLARATDVPTERRAYLTAKRRWQRLRAKELSQMAHTGLAGDTVTVDDREFVVHGITHANTDAERRTLRERVGAWIADGDAVYCEQGIRPMYFEDVPAVYAMDDYRWATQRGRERGLETDGTSVSGSAFDGISTDLASLTAQARRLSFLFAETTGTMCGEAVGAAIGRTASELLASNEQRAVADDFASFRRSREAAADPTKLGELQRYYKRTFLPQPLEREWLRRQDPQLELFTHARNERLADYARYHADADRVRLVVGAAHQPGVTYYLRAHRDGRRDLGSFEPVA
jgi:hypothetical protein